MQFMVSVNECCFYCFSESYIDSSVYNPSQLASTQHCQVDQPNIDLQVTLTQRWPGLNALLIDVAPYCLLANECDLELTLFEENGGSWRIPAGKTFSPPFFNEVNFLLCMILYTTVSIFHCDCYSGLLLQRPDIPRVHYFDSPSLQRFLHGSRSAGWNQWSHQVT